MQGKPRKPKLAEKRITVRFPEPLVSQLERMAERNYSTVSEEVRRLVVKAEQQERKAA